jgi:hypothetical protein
MERAVSWDSSHSTQTVLTCERAEVNKHVGAAAAAAQQAQDERRQRAAGAVTAVRAGRDG